MIMRRGEALLLPARPWFIALSLLLALLASLLPLGRTPWMPDWLALVLVFWSVHQPRRVGVFTAFVLGLVMDVQQAALLGQHALAYALLSFGAVALHRRLRWFELPGQVLHVLPLFLLGQLVMLLVGLAAGGLFPGWTLWLAPLAQTLLWPLATLTLLAPQRRAPDPDQNRPL
jgi:rod shape-determining protein MreD